MIAVACLMAHKAHDVVKLHLDTLEAKKKDTKTRNIRYSTGLLPAIIIIFVNGRSYEEQLENGLHKITST